MVKRNWNREELILAFNLYCKTPFGRIHIRNENIIALASSLGRTPSAVSWKLANFARLDPALKARHIAGATHGAEAETKIWEEFNGNWDKLAFESERLMAELSGTLLEAPAEIAAPVGVSREALVKIRVNQAFFRASVLAAYNSTCCITGLNVPTLLIASHIKGWAVDPKNRTNPRNGLCLNALHDRAFDCGLITVTPDYRVRVSSRIARSNSHPLRSFFLRYVGRPINLPSRFLPDKTFLQYHCEAVFQG